MCKQFVRHVLYIILISKPKVYGTYKREAGKCLIKKKRKVKVSFVLPVS